MRENSPLSRMVRLINAAVRVRRILRRWEYGVEL